MLHNDYESEVRVILHTGASGKVGGTHRIHVEAKIIRSRRFVAAVNVTTGETFVMQIEHMSYEEAVEAAIHSAVRRAPLRSRVDAYCSARRLMRGQRLYDFLESSSSVTDIREIDFGLIFVPRCHNRAAKLLRSERVVTQARTPRGRVVEGI